MGKTNRLSFSSLGIAAFVMFSLLSPRSIRDASAEELTPAFVAEHGQALVVRVVFEGNRRTRTAALEELVPVTAGMRLGELDPEALRQNLLKSGILSEVELSAIVTQGSAVVTVSVKEKWTLIPIPSASFGSDRWSARLSVLEYNFLGLRKSLVVSASDSNLGLGGIVAYSDPRFLRTRASLSAFASGGRASKEARYMDESIYASFVETTGNAGLSVGYPSEERLSGSLELTLRYSGVDRAATATYGLYEDSLVLVPGLAINYDARRSVGYRKAGSLAKASYTHGLGIRGMSSYDSIELGAATDLDLPMDGFLELGFSGRYSDRVFQALGALSGLGFRTIPQGYSFSPRQLAAYIDLMLPFLKAGWSVMEAGPFYEAGAYETGLEGEKGASFHGPGFCYRLYLRNIALPAVEIAAAYNIPAENFIVGVNLGISF